jgi:hypothetical protein
MDLQTCRTSADHDFQCHFLAEQSFSSVAGL